MSSGDRFYLMKFNNRDVQYGDVGSLLKIEGIVVGGNGASAVLLLPSSSFPNGGNVTFVHLNDEEWSDFIHRSDDPEILTGGPDGNLPKIFQRKLRYEISGAVQQKVWAADGFKCMYCGRKMGEVQLTIDHLFPLEHGGENEPSNYLSACRKCNKDKGSENPKSWCERKGLDLMELIDYLAVRVLP